LYISSLENYKNFSEKIYNKNVLKNIVFNSKLFYNKLEFENKNKIDFFYESNFIEKFVYESNRTE
jgi:hypothetical protein